MHLLQLGREFTLRRRLEPKLFDSREITRADATM